MDIPKDPGILLSFINTKLRDFYPSLEELCQALGIEQQMIIEKLKQMDYHYDPSVNRFI